MDNTFEIPVVYNKKYISFIGSLITYGYSYKIQVEINEQLFFFERDDSNDFRALLDYNSQEHVKVVDVQLLQLIAEKINELLT